MHLEFGKFIARTLDVPLGRDKYNLIVLSLAGFLCLAFLAWFYKGLKQNPAEENRVTIRYLIFTLALIVISINVIMVVNVELIHVVQYAIFAILIFAIVERYFDVLFWTTFFGAIDELYQYMYLAPNSTDYFDINDVIINMTGAAMGLILLRSQGIYERKPRRKILRTSWFWGIIFVLALITILWLSGQLTIYPSEGNVIFEFIREFTPGFWREIPPKVLFHVIQPFEGLIILIVLFAIYYKIPLKREENRQIEAFT